MSESTKNIFLASRDKRSKRLLDLFNQHYNIVGTYNEKISLKDNLLWFTMALPYFYPDYRKYRQISRSAPFAIDYRAKRTEKTIRELNQNIDFIFQFGATYPPVYRKPSDLSYFVYTDSCCDPDDKTFPWRWRAPRVYKAYTKKQTETFQNAKLIFTHSQWAKSLIKKVHGIDDKKIIVAGSGPILDPVEQRIPFEQKKNIILFIGGDFERKGVDILRKSVNKVAENVADVEFIVIGKNSDRMKFTPHESFKLLGPIFDRAIVGEYYSRAKAFVLPSRFEPLGHVLWEAMSYSTPVIVADTGGMPETVKEGYNGFIFPVDDDNKLADCIIDILKNDQLAEQLSHNAKNRFDEMGRWEHVFDRIKTGIESVL